MRQLGVTTANPMPLFPGQGGQYSIGYGGFLKHVPLEDFIAEAIDDNAEKLDRAAADERHLFIWVTESDHTNWPRLATDQVPSGGPSYEAPVDLVWVGLWSYRYSTESFAARLWTISRDGAWLSQTVPATRSYASARLG